MFGLSTSKRGERAKEVLDPVTPIKLPSSFDVPVRKRVVTPNTPRVGRLPCAWDTEEKRGKESPGPAYVIPSDFDRIVSKAKSKGKGRGGADGSTAAARERTRIHGRAPPKWSDNASVATASDAPSLVDEPGLVWCNERGRWARAGPDGERAASDTSTDPSSDDDDDDDCAGGGDFDRGGGDGFGEGDMWFPESGDAFSPAGTPRGRLPATPRRKRVEDPFGIVTRAQRRDGIRSHKFSGGVPRGVVVSSSEGSGGRGASPSSSANSSSSVDWRGRRVKPVDRRRRTRVSRATGIERALASPDAVTRKQVATLASPKRGRSGAAKTRKKAAKKKDPAERAAERAAAAASRRVEARFRRAKEVLHSQIAVQELVRRARSPTPESSTSESSESSRARRSRLAANPNASPPAPRRRAAAAREKAPPSGRDGWILGQVRTVGGGAGPNQQYFYEGDKRFKFGGTSHTYMGIDQVAMKTFNAKALQEVRRAEEAKERLVAKYKARDGDGDGPMPMKPAFAARDRKKKMASAGSKARDPGRGAGGGGVGLGSPSSPEIERSPSRAGGSRAASPRGGTKIERSPSRAGGSRATSPRGGTKIERSPSRAGGSRATSPRGGTKIERSPSRAAHASPAGKSVSVRDLARTPSPSFDATGDSARDAAGDHPAFRSPSRMNLEIAMSPSAGTAAERAIRQHTLRDSRPGSMEPLPVPIGHESSMRSVGSGGGGSKTVVLVGVRGPDVARAGRISPAPSAILRAPSAAAIPASRNSSAGSDAGTQLPRPADDGHSMPASPFATTPKPRRRLARRYTSQDLHAPDLSGAAGSAKRQPSEWDKWALHTRPKDECTEPTEKLSPKTKRLAERLML